MIRRIDTSDRVGGAMPGSGQLTTLAHPRAHCARLHDSAELPGYKLIITHAKLFALGLFATSHLEY
jgi:hypothetical protein